MSNLNLQYDLNLNKSSINLQQNNYYERKVKEGIPIFQEINQFNRTANGQGYIDPFKLLENSKSNYYLNNGGQSSIGIGPLSSNINISDIETRKIIEREMNPYLLQMKNELNMIVENLRKEFDNKSNILNEITFLKEQIVNNKQYNEDNNTNLENKMLNLEKKINIQEKKLNDYKNDIIQINRFNQDINQRSEEMLQNFNELERLKDKVMSLDSSNENVYKEITQNIEKNISYKIDQLEKNINALRGENSSIKRDISQNNIKLEFLESESEKRDKKINELEANIYNLANQIKNMNLNNNKNLNILNNFEIKNNEFQQMLKTTNDQLQLMNNNYNSTLLDVKSQKQLIDSLGQKNSEIENSMNSLKNERQNLNNKILELNLKIESQKEKITKNNALINDSISNNNSTLYKDLTTQITKSKDLIENLRENFELEIEKLRGEINQFDQIIKNNPFLNMNENERISFQFKSEQNKTNQTFKEQITLLIQEVEKLKKVNPSDKNNFITIENNFKIIDKTIVSQKKEIKALGDTMKTYGDVVSALSEKLDKLKKEGNSYKNDKINAGGKAIVPMVGDLNFNEFEEKVKKYINNNKEDVKNLKIDIQEMNEKTIPEIYNYINSKLKQINNMISRNSANNNLNSKPSNNGSDFINYNSILESNNFNKKPLNINNNNQSPKINDNYNNNNNNINDNIIKNENLNNNGINNKSINIDDIANKIELMGNQENNNNKENDKEHNDSNWSLSNKSKKKDSQISINDKINESDSIDKIIENAKNEEILNSRKDDGFDDNFDD